MAKSILTDDMEHCYLCRRPAEHIHHIFFGTGNRMVSDREGFTVPLCAACHTGDGGVHFNPELNRYLRQTCQRKYEETHSRKEFVRLVGRNYL